MKYSMFKNYTYTIDEDFHLIDFNQAISESFPGVQKGMLCHEIFCHRTLPCPECPRMRKDAGGSTLFKNPFTKTWISSTFADSFTKKGEHIYIVICRPLSSHDDEDRYFHKLADLETREHIATVLQNEALYRRALFADALYHYEVNLTRDTIIGDVFEEVNGKDIPVSKKLHLSKNKSFTKLQEYWESTCVAFNLQEHIRICRPYSLIIGYFSGDYSPEVSYSIVTPDGNEHWHRQTHYLTRDESTGDIIAKVIIKDITEATQKEKELQRNHELIESLSSDYTSVLYVDIKADAVLSYSLDAISDDRVGPILRAPGSTFSSSMEEYVNRFVAESDRASMLRVLSKKGVTELFSEKPSFSVLYLANYGYSDNYIEAKFVRTDRESELTRFVIGFADKDEETRHELDTQRELLDALNAANAANRAKTEFLFNMSHDIRTPMNAIIGFTTLAQANIDSTDKIRDYLSKISASSSHLLSLINDVLDMSRIESGKMTLTETPCNIPDLLHELRTIILGQVHSKQLELQMDIVDVINEDVYCDRTRFQQVLVNLLSNAVKFTPPGGTVSICMEQSPEAPEGYASFEIHVKDNGIGMSSEFAAHVFEAFERERNSTVSGTQGTGLGMAITKRIVDMMGGKIKLITEPDKGTEFIVSIMLKICTDKTDKTDVTDDSALKGLHVLIVDDDYESCCGIAKMLNRMNVSSDWTMMGKEALLRSQQAAEIGKPYSAYLIDWQLSDLNGLEVARRLRATVDKNIPLIILTAYDWADVEKEAIESGVTSFCAKPLFMSGLKTALLTCMGVVPPQPTDEAPDIKENEYFKGKRILLAEDNELNTEITVELLSGYGFLVETAINGREAVNMVKASKRGYYSLILMDIQMPVLDGYEATEEIRKLKNSALANLPIIAMTANAFEEDRLAALAHGMNGFIPKPIRLEQMIGTLKTIFIT